MTESDDDLFNRNVLNYPNGSTTFSVKGPSINITSMNMRNAQLNPGLQSNFGRQRYAKSCIDQKSYRRDISPMSICSALEMPRSYSHQTEATFSASAKKIALAFREAEIDMGYNNDQIYSNDLKLIKDSYQKFMKKVLKRKFSKKKGFVTSGRQYKANSQDLYEDLTSDSSSSSSEDKSPRMGLKNDNNTISCRSTKSNFSLPKSNTKVNNTCRGGNPGNIDANLFGNISSIQPVNVQPAQNRQNIPIMPKNRFKKGYDLPCQRFNRSTIQESNENILHNNESNLSGHKRNHNDDNINSPQKKRQKTSSTPKTLNASTIKENDFNFLIPKFPLRKSANAKKSGEEIISSTVLHPSSLNIENSPKTISDKQAQMLEDNETNSDRLSETDIGENNNNTSDVSMRPSFIKRKLFTQKLEVTEKRNLSTDSVQSPQTGYSVWQKDKTKPRKLTTTQSCLTRDIDREDNNLYDLISKIVPADHINKQDNKTVIKKPVVNGRNKETVNISSEKSKKSKSNDDDDWDIVSIISTCNLDAASETYTDDENFEVNKNNVTDQTKNKKQESQKPASKNAVADDKSTKQTVPPKNFGVKSTKINTTNKTVLTTFKSFWDTDLETDSEFTPKKNYGVSQKEIVINLVSGNDNRSISTLHKDNSEGLGSIFIFNGNLKTPLPKSNKTSNLANDLQNSHNLRARAERTVKNSCCNESITSNKNSSGRRSLPKNHLTQKNKELVSKNKDEHQNNTEKLKSSGVMPKNQNKKKSITNKLTRRSSIVATSKITAMFNKEQKK